MTIKRVTCIEFGNKNMEFVKVSSGGVFFTVWFFVRHGQATGLGVALKCYKNKLPKSEFFIFHYAKMYQFLFHI